MLEEERLMFEGWAKLPQFKKKVEKSTQVIKESLNIGDAYVACSWGKDSVVLTHICQQVKQDISVISFGHPERIMISNYEEVERIYCEQFAPNLTTVMIEGDHVPLKVNKARLWGIYPVAFIGLRKEESVKRRQSLCKNGLIYQTKSHGWRACPLADWHTNDVWAYTVNHKLPYLKAYDLGALRTTDHVSKSLRKDYQSTRIEELRKTAPQYYQYLQNQYPEMFYATN